MEKIKIGIYGATGYAGLNVFRLLSNHPNAEIKYLSSLSSSGEGYRSIYPTLKTDIILGPNDPFSARDLDACFTAMPAGETSAFVKELLDCNPKLKVIDLGADFRFTSLETYERSYGVKHNSPHILKDAVYGLPEVNRELIKGASVIGNPGCYPTSVILGVYPLVKEFGESIEAIISDSKSGVSGAGRKVSRDYLFCEVNESVRPYGAKFHRHQPEMSEKIKLISPTAPDVIFTPHLIPMQRGILSTIYVFFKEAVPEEKELTDLYAETFKNESFVILLKDKLPATAMVRSSNCCAINVCKTSSRSVKVFSVIDNLIKGAAGQAVQNFNLLFGLPEYTALENIPEVI